MLFGGGKAATKKAAPKKAARPAPKKAAARKPAPKKAAAKKPAAKKSGGKARGEGPNPWLKDSISNLFLIFQPNEQTLQGSLSSVSTPNFASKYSLESS